MVLKPSAAQLPFCLALSPSVHWHAHFLYFCSLYNFFFLGFRQWQSSTDRVLTLNMNIHPLFWSTWSPARGQDSATCAGLAYGRDYSCCRASELKLQKFLASVFSWIVENTFKLWPMVRVFQPSPTGLVWAGMLQMWLATSDSEGRAPLQSSSLKSDSELGSSTGDQRGHTAACCHWPASILISSS